MHAWLDRISPMQLMSTIGTADAPLILDVRREAALRESGRTIPAAVWRAPELAHQWSNDLRPSGRVVVSCAHGHNVSEMVGAILRARGIDAAVLEGGLSAYVGAGGATIRTDVLTQSPSAWVTRARPKIDRVACPWFIRRFVDRDAKFYFVAADWVSEVAEESGAIAFDIPGARFSHDGEQCSFDAFLKVFGVDDPALHTLAPIIRGADTGRLDLAPECAGLLAAALGGAASGKTDLEVMERGFAIYNALYAWAKYARTEKHGWPPA